MAVRKTNRQLAAAGSTRLDSIEHELSRLEELSLDQLRHAWHERLGHAPPPLRTRDMMLRMLAWQIQADAFGGFDAKTQRHLKEIAKGFARDPAYRPKAIRPLSPGVVLTREWKGVLQRVTITPEGFTHLGRQYASLSDVARAITGTRWSGPRFFGLEQKEREAALRKKLP